MLEQCECCNKFTELEEAQDYWGNKIYLCSSCFKKAEIRADYEQERYKEEGGR